jgi:diaminohydroxyphosphoribosylaminopyrimidine deaminase / 5-amino-6-(5-phosphoribosylamino)uracil reductase
MERDSGNKYMRRCLDLASKAEGMTYPNPMVGALLVHNEIIIGEGYHLRSGGRHAEVIAIDSVTDKSLLSESVLYVSLEPCSHFGKTPPCTDLILETHIPTIVIGTTDTSMNVAGNGIKKMTESGRQVITGVLQEECRRLNRRFFTFHEKKRPYITLKWARSKDGFIDAVRNAGSPVEPRWISGKPERVLVHKWRSEEQAILVGAGTVRNDNPLLNVRYWSGADPLRLILSNSGETGKYLALNETNGTVIVFTGTEREKPGNNVRVKLVEETPASVQIADYLYKQGIQSLLIEGGAKVLDHFIETGLWDEARIFTGRVDFKNGIKAPEIKGTLYESSDFESTRLETFINNYC